MNTYENKRLAQAASCLGPPISRLLEPHFPLLEESAQEIRLRVDRPLCVKCGDKSYFITNSGSLTDLPCGDLYRTGLREIDSSFQRICNYSVYARQREIINGFITLAGGHRAGICGTAVVRDGRIINIRDISSVNLRIAREHRGCAGELYRLIKHRAGGVLICGEPCSGKTTVLRDLARSLSADGGSAVSLIDERGELAATVSGVAQNDVGLCDVFDGYPKAYAMEQALRTMSPQTIICDEIGSPSDVSAAIRVQSSGVRIIASAHARSRKELFERIYLRKLLDLGVFSTVVFLRGRARAGEIAEITGDGDCFAA